MQTNASPATGTGIRHRDLTLATGAPAAVGQPRGYAFDAQKTGHVMFRGADDRVHELWWEESGWHLGDLSRAAPASAICVSELAAYVSTAQCYTPSWRKRSRSAEVSAQICWPAERAGSQHRFCSSW